MRTLFFDLSAPTGLLACVEDATVASLEVDQRIGDHEVLTKVQELLKKAGWQMTDLTHVAAITGPGGFTSLRVEVAFANAISWGLKIPIAGIHNADLWHARTKMEDGVWIHSTKKDLLFIRGVGSFAEKWPEPVTIELATLLDLLAANPGTSFCGQLIEEHEKAVIGQGARRSKEEKVNQVLPKLLRLSSFSMTPLIPWYGRGW